MLVRVRAKGAALHSHSTVEVFIPLSGTWSIYWGDEGEQEGDPGRLGHGFGPARRDAPDLKMSALQTRI